MTQEQMMAEINAILSDSRKKAHVDQIVPLLHGKWELQIMLEVCRADVLRFGEYKRRLPHITNSVLTAALRNLEKWGLVTRTQYNEIPPRVEYARKRDAACCRSAMRSSSGARKTAWTTVRRIYESKEAFFMENMQEIAAKPARELPSCPVETTLMMISDKWKVLILRDLLPGTKRFGELKKSIGNVSQKVLTAQLRQMEQSGLVRRTVYAEVPPRVEYSLTELGYSLKPVMDALWNWGAAYQAKNS